jgi:uncharacterized membrane protein YgdD (TMEM256/DUF423 family)
MTVHRQDTAAAAATGRRVRLLAAAGALLGLTAVAAGAFGAHALKSAVTPERLAVFETGVRYQLVHALALFACAWTMQTWPGRLAFAAGACFVAGALLFSGSLYALVLSGEARLGIVTPFGGLAFLIGWILLTASIVRRSESSDSVG